MMLFLLSIISICNAGIHFSRTVSNVASGSSFKLVIEGNACSKTDEYGSDDCQLNWSTATANTTYTVDFQAILGQTLGAASHFEVNLKVDRFINWKFQCPICG